MNPYDMIYDLNDVVNELTQQLEVAKASLSKWESVFGHLGTPDEVGNEWVTMSDRLEVAEKERDELRALVVAANLVAQVEIVRRVGFVDTPNDKDSCAAFCVAEGTWLELMSAVESLASALAAAPEAKP